MTTGSRYEVFKENSSLEETSEGNSTLPLASREFLRTALMVCVSEERPHGAQ